MADKQRPVFAYSSVSITKQKQKPSKTAIVSISTNCLHPNPGADEEIRIAGGTPLQQSITDKRNEDLANGILFYPTGSVVPTSAGNLNADYVFHAIIQPIMKISRLFLYTFQVKYLLGNSYKEIIQTAEKLDIQYLIIPVIDPDALSTEESINIAVTSIIKFSKKIVEVTFVASDVYSKFVAKYTQNSQVVNVPNFSLFEDLEFSRLNRAQKLFSSTFQPDEDVPIITNKFSIGVTSKDPELVAADVLCIVVNKQLRPSDRSFDRYASEIEPPISDKKKFENRFVFVSATQNMPHKNTMSIVLESIPKFSKNKSRILQSILGNIYVSILREAHTNGFKSLVVPVITLSKSDVDISIVLSIYACVNASVGFEFQKITFYHHNEKVVNRFLYMLALKGRRFFATPLYTRLFLESFPKFPCDKEIMALLPKLTRLLWDTIPCQVKRVQSNALPPVMHVRQLSSNSNTTKLTILNSNIINVPAINGAVINAANSLLKFGSGIAKALRDAGGVEAQNECDALMSLYRQNGINSLPAGSAAITNCGRITHCSKMIHGVGPQIVAGRKPTNEDMYRLQVTYEQIFRLAGSANMELLVVPFISTGVFAIDMLQGMKIALYATLKSLPNYGLRSVIFVHTDMPIVQQFRALIANKNELTFDTRSDADALLRTYCAHFIPSYSSSMTRKVDAEIERVWKVTERLLISHPNSYIRNTATLVATGHAPSKRRMTPAPPGRHKKSSHLAHSEDDEMVGVSEVATETEDPGLMKRLKAALRQKRRRSGETEEQASERKKKDAERQRKKRLSQNEAQTVVDDDEMEIEANKNRERQKKYRERQTQEQRAARLKRDREEKAAARNEETNEQRVARLEKVKAQIAAAREEETQEQRSSRLKKDQEKKALGRQNLDRDKRALIREKDKERRANIRLNETVDQRRERQFIDALRHKKRRENETPEERDARRKRDAERHRWHRHDPTRPLRKPGSSIITDQQKNYPQSLPEYWDLGECPVCKYCQALTYTGKCCFGGQVHVRLLAEPPKKLQKLLIGNSDDADHVRKHIMRYNRSFQMASISCEREPSLRSNQFIKINGGMHFQMSGYERPEGSSLALFNQIYQFDPEEATAARLQNIPELRKPIVRRLSKYFHKHNYLAKQFRKTSKLERALARGGITVPEKILQLRAPTRKELGGNHPGVMSRPMKELRASVLYRTDEHGSAPAHGVWVCKEGRKMTQLQYFDPLTDPLCYPLIFTYGEGGFKYGEDKLFPKGTTREEAGYIYNDARMPSNIEESLSSPRDEILSTSSISDEDYEDDAEDDAHGENEEQIGSDDDEDMLMYSANSNPWDLSSTTRYQIARDVSFFDKNEFDYEKRPQLDIDMQDCPEDAVEFGYSSDEDNNENSDEEEGLIALVAAISMEESYDQAMDSPNEALETQNDQESNEGELADKIVEVPDDEAEFEQSEIMDGDEAIKETKRIMVSRRQHYLYLFRERFLDVDSDRRYFNPCGASTHQLSQFFIIDQYLRMVKQRNDYARSKLVELRGSSAKSFMMAVLEKRAAKNDLNVGYSFSLSRKTPGSVAWYREKYVNAMIMIDKVGHPDIFLTFTGNRNWPECTKNFGRNSDWQSNPIILCEVFHKKSQELLNDVVNRELFGRVAGYAYSIEFQKRGMPHLHLLITLQKSDKLNTIERIEKHVWARIPELDSLPPNATEEQILKRKNQKQLQQLVKDFMVHSPCKGDVRAYCQTKLPPAHYQKATWPQCSKKYPKELEEHTSINEDGSVNYYRPAMGPALEVKDSSGDMVHAGNEWVVPYNPYLLAKYKSHINVEVVSQTHVAKYMYKYIFKGFDRALVEFRDRVENNPNNDDRSRTTMQNGVFAPSKYAKNSEKMEIASRRMRVQARKLGVENDGEATVNYDEAILTECFRQTTAAEAAWGLLGFPLAGCSHKVKTLHVHEPDNPPMAYVRGKEKEAERALNEGRYISPFMAYMNLNRGNTREEDSENDFFDEEFMDEEDVDEEEGVMNEDDAADRGDNEDEYGDSQRRRRDFLDDAAVSDGDDEEDDPEYWAEDLSTSGGRGQTQLPLPTQRPDQTQTLPRATNFFETLIRARNSQILP